MKVKLNQDLILGDEVVTSGTEINVSRQQAIEWGGIVDISVDNKADLKKEVAMSGKIECEVLKTISEGGFVRVLGDKIPLTPERARQLKGYVRPLENKSMDAPPMNKMVDKPAKKKGRPRKRKS